MCVDALLGTCVMGTGLDLWPASSRIGLLFGWASWQVLGVATAVCVALFNYKNISDHWRYYFTYTQRQAQYETWAPWNQSNQWTNLDWFQFILTLPFLAMLVTMQSVSLSLACIQTVMCWHLLNRLDWNFVQTFMVLRQRWLTLVVAWRFYWLHHEVLVYGCKVNILATWPIVGIWRSPEFLSSTTVRSKFKFLQD